MLKLIKYEYRKDLPAYLVLASILFVSEFYFLISVLTDSNTNLMVSTMLFIIGGVFGVIALMVLGIVSYSREINSKYSYMTFMTPNSPYKIMGAKYLALLIVTVLASVIYVGFIFLDVYIIYSKYHNIKDFIYMVKKLAATFGWNFDSYIYSFIATMITELITFFFTVSCAYLSITLSTTLLSNKKGKGILSVLIFVVIIIIVSRISKLLPSTGDYYTMEDIITGNIFIYLFQSLMIAGTYFFVSYMLKKKISL